MSPYVLIAARRTTPCSSRSSYGSSTGSAPHRFVKREVRVFDEQRDVAYPVAMLSDVLTRDMPRIERRRDHEPHPVLPEHIRRELPVPRLQPAVRDLREAEGLRESESNDAAFSLGSFRNDRAAVLFTKSVTSPSHRICDAVVHAYSS